MSRVAKAWVLTRSDGVRLGFTDHDEALRVDGVECRPGSGFTPSVAQTRLGFAFDNGALSGVLDDSRITADDIATGLYAGARVAQWRVDWTGGAAPELLRTLRLGGIVRRTDGHFEAEAVGLAAALEEVGGRVVSRLCAAHFADAACGLDAGDFPDGTTCARSLAACRAFGNTASYRGFPHLIGEDALVQGVDEALPLDGGSRYGDRPDV